MQTAANIKNTEGFRNDAVILTDTDDKSVYYIDGERFAVSGVKLAVHIYSKLAATKSQGGIILPDSVGKRDALDAPVGQVVAVGPDAYKDDMVKTPYCQIKDWVVFPRALANRMNWEDKAQIVFIDDVAIIGTVPRPDGIKKAIPIDKF